MRCSVVDHGDEVNEALAREQYFFFRKSVEVSLEEIDRIKALAAKKMGSE